MQVQFFKSQKKGLKNLIYIRKLKLKHELTIQDFFLKKET